jgi:hypothetical protein
VFARAVIKATLLMASNMAITNFTLLDIINLLGAEGII